MIFNGVDTDVFQCYLDHLWLRLKADYFSDFIARSTEELNSRLCVALNALMDDYQKVASQCATRK